MMEEEKLRRQEEEESQYDDDEEDEEEEEDDEEEEESEVHEDKKSPSNFSSLSYELYVAQSKEEQDDNKEEVDQKEVWCNRELELNGGDGGRSSSRRESNFTTSSNGAGRKVGTIPFFIISMGVQNNQSCEYAAERLVFMNTMHSIS